MKSTSLLLLLFALAPSTWAQIPTYEEDPFRQLDELLPTPNEQRLATGTPGPGYWQQKADYLIKAKLDENKNRILGEVTITYHNRSPHVLDTLWVQLDQNRFAKDADGLAATEAPKMEEFSFSNLDTLLQREKFDGGNKIRKVVDKDGRAMAHEVIGTVLRLDLESPLKTGKNVTFTIGWDHNIVDAKRIRARGGYEFFEKDKNAIYTIAQWFPRMCAYTDTRGWQHKVFLGRGEFALEFGDYRVELTVPADHVVAATGELVNADKVLTPKQRERLKKAESATLPVFIVTLDEAKAAEKKKETEKTKTWIFEAKNIRDFAWASSRKYAWDAVKHRINGDGPAVWAMSVYPNEGEPLWSKYSTHSVMHALDVYSEHCFDYPYPVAISAMSPVFGMEYPMMTFNGPRPEDDGTYSERMKAALIAVIIHEVGHNWFPMIVNSDERQWTWMDEGLNSFMDFIATESWEEKFPSRSGHARTITSYMSGPRQIPIMTNSESLKNFGANAYAKPAAALNILREVVLGREIFDRAFREYSTRWMFKRPEPADFFRAMEDAAGVDLDWFWRGWFYTTKHVDVAIGDVYLYDLDSKDPDVEKPKKKQKRDDEPLDLTEERNKDIEMRIDLHPELADFYNEFDELDVTESDREKFEKYVDGLEPREKRLLKTQRRFYVVEFENLGGLMTPLPLKMTFDDGKTMETTLPPQIWRYNPDKISKLFLTKKKIAKIEFDPGRNTADTNTENNVWPPEALERTFELKPRKKDKNPMQLAKEAEEKAKKAAESQKKPAKETEKAEESKAKSQKKS
ncbi:MAG: M1 family metallopeptidase [Verrucomicrobiota bacterium]